MIRSVTIRELWRYPVKSMAGERLGSTTASGTGLVGDRAFAVIEEASGHVASAKHPRKWATLLRCTARYLDPATVAIALPDGAEVSSDDPRVRPREWCLPGCSAFTLG